MPPPPPPIPEKMRVVAIKDGKGPISSLYIDENYPVPTLPHVLPQDDASTSNTSAQALIHIKAFGINRMDLLQREGKYPVPPQAEGLPMGVEFSGVVVKLSSESSDFEVGDEVFGLAYGGAYAEYVAVSTRMLIKKPQELGWEVCAGIPETWITATQALYLVGGFETGKSVLWHAGASNVSISGIQLAKADGAKGVYVTTSSKEKIEFCKKVGADEGFSYKDEEKDWADQVLEATGGKGVDIIIDFVGGGSYFEQNLKAIAKDGRIVLLGLLGGPFVKPQTEGMGVNIGPLLMKRVRIEGSTLRSRDENYQGKLRDMLVEHALPRFRDGTFRVPIEKVLKMDQIQEAHEIMEGNGTMGKLICRVDWE